MSTLYRRWFSVGALLLNGLSSALLVMAVPTCSGSGTEPQATDAGAPRQSIERLLAIGTVRAEDIRPAKPRWELPFAARPAEPLLSVEHDLALPGRKSLLRARSFFSTDGKFVGAESMAVIDDPRRMSRAVVEQGMRNRKERIVAPAELADRSALDTLWQAVAAQLNVEEIKEYDLHYVEYEFHDGVRRRVFVLNVRGPQNPLGMPDEFPDVLKNRIRIIYDVDQKTLAADNLL